jgi:hypothetical protein
MFAKLLGSLLVAVALGAPLASDALAVVPPLNVTDIGVREDKPPCCRPGYECCKNVGQDCCRPKPKPPCCRPGNACCKNGGQVCCRR